MSAAAPSHHTSVPATPQAPGRVRGWLARSVPSCGPALSLVASELVTSAVIDMPDQGESLEVEVSPVLGAFHVSVAHRGPGAFDGDLVQRLLDGMSRRWGEDRVDGRVVRWAEIRRPGTRTAVVSADDEELLLRGKVDEEARAEIVRRYLPMAQQIAARYRGSGSDSDDLEQVAGLALMKAMSRFDPEAGRFEHYAAATISGELKRHLRDRCWSVRVPRGLQESVLEVSRVSRILSQRLGRTPDPDDIARETGWSRDDVLEALQAGGAFRSFSLDAPRGPDSEATVMDTLGEVDGNLKLAEQWHTVTPALQRLPERERHILYLRFYEDLTQSEIADIVGVSQMHVSRLLARALDKLRLMTA